LDSCSSSSVGVTTLDAVNFRERTGAWAVRGGSAARRTIAAQHIFARIFLR
jgi:hypothetical protein